MATFAELLNATPRRAHGQPCGVTLILEQLDEKNRAEMLDALGRRSVEATQIVRVLEAMGFEIKDHTVRRHRNRGCSCGSVR